mgnify:CR=1 FL=1
MSMKNITEMKESTNRAIRYLGALGSLLLVCSCAVYKTGFECSPGAGEGCKSVSQVNEMVSRGEIGKNLSIWQKREENLTQDNTLKNINATSYKTKSAKTGLTKAEKLTKEKNTTTKASGTARPIDKNEKKGCACSKK